MRYLSWLGGFPAPRTWHRSADGRYMVTCRTLTASTLRTRVSVMRSRVAENRAAEDVPKVNHPDKSTITMATFHNRDSAEVAIQHHVNRGGDGLVGGEHPETWAHDVHSQLTRARLRI